MAAEQLRAEAGLDEALARLQDRLDHRTADPLISLAEVLSWLYTLEELVSQAIGRQEYFRRRSNSDDGRAMGGIIYARGAVQHKMISVGVLVDVFTLDVSCWDGGDVLDGRWRWSPFADLPTPPPDRPEQHGRGAMYQDRVEHRPLMDPLVEARRFLTSIGANG